MHSIFETLNPTSMNAVDEHQIHQQLKRKNKHIVLVEKNDSESLELYTFNRSVINRIDDFENNYYKEREGFLKQFLSFLKKVFRLN